MGDAFWFSYGARISLNRLPAGVGVVVLVAFNILALTAIGVYNPLPRQNTHLPVNATQWSPSTSYLSAAPIAPPTFLGVSWSRAKKRPPPPATCDHCLINPEDELCEYGRDNIRMSRAFDGSGVRVRRMLEKALRGEPIGVGIIGASVSVGHGIPLGTTRWWEQFQRDFTKLFPKATFHFGGVSGMNSNFFSSCFGSVLPNDLDFYITELDVNNDPSDATYIDDDALMRGLLSLPQEPAVLRVSVFAIIFTEMTRGYTSTLTTSHWHDVPVVGIRNWLLPHVMRHEETLPDFFGVDQFYKTDYRHVGAASHVALGDMVSLYIREQVCETERRMAQPSLGAPKNGTIWPQPAELGTIPSKHMWFNFFTQKVIPPNTPSCQLAGESKTPLIATHTHGNWTPISWNGKDAIVADKPGSAASFKFIGSQVGVYVWVSGQPEYGAGASWCWVDGQRESGVWVESWQQRDAAGPVLFPIAKDLAWGHHFLTCEVAYLTKTGGYEFRIIGIASL